MTPSRLTIFVGFVVLAESAFYAVVPPLVPGFVRDLQMTTPEVGILVAAYPAGVVLAAYPSIALVHRRGVRATSFAGLAALIVSTAAFALAPNPALLDLARLVQGVGGELAWAGAVAWLTAATPVQRRGSMIGGTLTAALIGMVLGPGIGALASTFGRTAIFGAIAAGLALTGLIAPRSSAPDTRRQGSVAAVTGLLRNPQGALGTGLLLGIGIVTGTIAALLPFLVTRRGGSAVLIAIILAAGYLLGSFISPGMGRLSDRFGRLIPAMLGFVVAGAILSTLPLWGTPAPLLVAAIVATGFISSLWTPTAAMVTDGVDAGQSGQAVAVATLNAAWAVGATVGASSAARVADAVGLEIPFYLLGAVCAISLAILVVQQRSVSAAAPAGRRAS